MIPASLYQPIYLIIVSILTFACLNKYKCYSINRLYKYGCRGNNILLYFVVILFALFIGLRPVDEKFFVDMFTYATYYHYWEGERFFFNWHAENVLFDNIILLFASRRVPIEFFFLLIAIIYFGGIAWTCHSLFPQDTMASLFVCLGAFSTFSYATNGIKAGAAASLFLVALALYENRHLLWAILFVLISWGFHHSMVVPVTAFVICIFVRNPKWLFALWLACFFVALFHITFFQQVFAGFADDRGANYLLGEGEHIRKDILGGFRIDFILYSAAPIVIGWFAIYKKKIKSKAYSFLLSFYLLTNAIWLLCMYAEFTNRIAYLSWFVYPIVLVYPFLKEEWSVNQYKTFRWVAGLQLAFTLFMFFVFYA